LLKDPTDFVDANMPYPIHQSAVGFTCGSDATGARFGTVESPNENPDADDEIRPTSHEISEAITDPDTQTGWYDATGNEIGDECAYVYGRARGGPGRCTTRISGRHFLPQEKFSNNDFIITRRRLENCRVQESPPQTS